MKFIKNVLLSCISVLLALSITLEANAHYTSKEFQESFFEIEYKEVHKSLSECNKHFNRMIRLPVQLPPVPFTHSFGRCNDLEGEINDKFEINFLHKDIPQNHYIIYVQPKKYGLIFRKNLINKKQKMNDGSIAIYSREAARGFNLLVFEKDEFQYILSVDKRISHIVTFERLMEIANSFS